MTGSRLHDFCMVFHIQDKGYICTLIPWPIKGVLVVLICMHALYHSYRLSVDRLIQYGWGGGGVSLVPSPPPDFSSYTKERLRTRETKKAVRIYSMGKLRSGALACRFKRLHLCKAVLKALVARAWT